MSENQTNQATFKNWAPVEVMGHQTHIGYVQTEVYGTAVMFRVDQPEIAEREYTLTSPEYVEGRYQPAGSVVKRPTKPGCTVLIGAGSIYRMLPCTQEAAILAIETTHRAELMLISVPIRNILEAAKDPSEQERDNDGDI